ncbi:hypothetical protein TorRG33x02_160840 [Trema orientale]|uniref:Uncharacterized protein n=1 Tax=Trema orientale TaxID=63057 RepID=A0A2P5ER77_TREOI|nr:hypothetical protein TorRG33x02_160840 [Trema orientale]
MFKSWQWSLVSSDSKSSVSVNHYNLSMEEILARSVRFFALVPNHNEMRLQVKDEYAEKDTTQRTQRSIADKGESKYKVDSLEAEDGDIIVSGSLKISDLKW